MPEPHDPDLDAAISADLDGELDAWCADAGLDPPTVRARLAGAEALARRAELVATRDALAAPVPTLDEVTRRRLVQGAMSDPATDVMIPTRVDGSGASDRSRQRWAVMGGIAASVLVVVAIVALAIDGGGGDGGGAKSSAGRTSAPTGDLGNVGTLDQKRVDQLVQGGGAAPKTGGAAAPSSGVPGAEGFTPDPERVPAARVTECAGRFASEGTVRFRASGEFQGRPAVVVGVDTATRTIVFVVAADDCARVLYSASR